MSIFNIFQKPPPPPPPIYKRQPVATIAVILTMIGMFVLGPVGAIYKSMSEELKQKVDNKTLQLMIEKDRDALKRHEDENKEQEEAIKQNQEAIQVLLREQAVLKVEKKAVITAPKAVKITGPTATAKPITEVKKPAVPPEYFEKYMAMNKEMRIKYKNYLSRKYDVEGLPD